jgi:hypothetical protein
MAVVDELRTTSPDVIFAEPVGSCTDISATVLGPLRESFDRYRLAPFTVLADPARTAALLSEDADPEMAFLFKQQINEADLVCLSKSDLYPNLIAIPGVSTRSLSAVTGQGVAEWLDEILFGALDPGHTTLDIDYVRYAQAEASLAWLNLSFDLELPSALSPPLVLGPFLDSLDAALSAAAIGIVHLKIIDTSFSGWLKAAICANGDQPSVEGNLDASPAAHHRILLNLRAKGDPAQVRRIVEDQLLQLPSAPRQLRLDCFSPAAPSPERRVPRTRP